MLGLIGGTSILFSKIPDLEKRTVSTPFGPAEVHCGDVALLLRHQYGLPPHRINYRACMAALAILGVDSVIALGSSGSLKRDIPPGSLLIPTDYISMTDIPSIHDHGIDHVSPEIDRDLAEQLAGLVPEARFGGIYVQTRGPRIETVAEVRELARCADVVGMTVASEATLARELGIRFAALCTVDNYAHGLDGVVLTYDHILEMSRRNRKRTEEIIRKIVESMA
jgi:5'-methylthioadenosine phosphorylase